MGNEEVLAQASKSQAGGIVCPANGGAVSIEVLPEKASRYSYGFINDSSIDVRLGFVSSGIPNLTDTNSAVIKAGQTYADSVPGVYTGRLVCMSNTTVAATIHFTEGYR